jgi:serine/threonine-protein kinase RsbW
MDRTESAIEPLDTAEQRDWEAAQEPWLDISAWMPSEPKAITPLVDRLMQLVQEAHCLSGESLPLELGLREALYNAVVHGNRLDPAKLVEIHCRSERKNELDIVVKDQGQGFDLNAVPNPLAAENLLTEHGRGILFMRHWMDEVWFEQGGTVVHMRKGFHTQEGNEIPRRGGINSQLPGEPGCASRS